MYQRQGKAAYKANLDNTWALAEITDHPQKTFKSIHIAGTNGKGSTAHMLSSIFQEAGYKTGLYTSPHLIDFRERIKTNGQMIPKESVIAFYQNYSSQWKKIQPSFFEMTVLMAFDHFREQKVDIAIIETGLGGRLDSTNIINPEVSVITNIGLDHTQFLGNTIELIAAEKAGIIKEHTPVILGTMLPEAENVMRQTAEVKKAPLLVSKPVDLESDLKGAFQKENMATVCKTIEVIQNQNKFYIQKPHITAGLENVKSNTGLRGRYDVLNLKPKTIADGAHNKAGLNTLLKELSKETFRELHIVWSMVSDKNVAEIFSLLPKNAHYYFCQSSVPRSVSVDILKQTNQEFGLNADYFDNVKSALQWAKKSAAAEDLIVVTGSFFTVGDALLIKD